MTFRLLKVGKPELLLRAHRAGLQLLRKRGAQHRCADRATGETVEPMVVRMLGAQLPFVNRPAQPFRPDAALRGQMLGEQNVLKRISSI